MMPAEVPQEEDVLIVRRAVESDLERVISFDQIVQTNEGRREYARRAIEGGACYVAEDRHLVTAYAVLRYSFFEQGFVELLYVAPGQRRQGVGSELMRYLESICSTPKLFTSTNLSNHPMQALLLKRGYKLSGVVNDLDPDDPELIYVRYLRGG